MADPLSTDDGLANDSYESLEDRLHNTDRNSDEECRTSVYLSHSFIEQSQIIEAEEDTNRTEVMLRAFTEGVCELRQLNFGERSNDIYNVVAKTNMFKGYSPEFAYETDHINLRTDTYTVDIGLEDVSVEDDPTKAVLRDSIYSEVQKRFDDILVFEPGVIRPIMIVGMSKSKHRTGLIEYQSEEIIGKIDDGLEEARENVEKNLWDYTAALYGYVRTEGIEEEQLGLLKDASSYMRTEHKDTVRLLINDIEENCDVY